jgi:hypothetical protein
MRPIPENRNFTIVIFLIRVLVMLFVGRLIAIFLEIWGYFMNMARVFESQEMRA